MGVGLPCGTSVNYLGHLFLSGTDPLVTTGNFMADEVKGRDLSRFSEPLQQGIRLHRSIDTFMDQHPSVQAGRARVRAHAGRYAGVVMDLFYDHLLAREWSRWNAEPLPDYAQRMYALLQDHEALLPDRIRYMLGFMIRRDWLTNYATISGIGRSIQGLSERVPRGDVMSGSEKILAEHIEVYQQEFTVFLPAILEHTRGMR